MKLDCWLESITEDKSVLELVKAGLQVFLSIQIDNEGEQRLQCLVNQSKLIGLLPQDLSITQNVEVSNLTCTVRSIKRGADDGCIKGIMIRIDDRIPSKLEQITKLLQSPTQQIQLQDNLKLQIQSKYKKRSTLTKQQLELLAQSQEVRQKLKDEKLQKMIQYVDDGENKSESLARIEEMFGDYEFQSFSNMVLDVVCPDEQN
eukprot:TRINITY_DN19036_c0_g1_i1.p2 TRINITY_DN19036_c0_g1~~TRINITY_DN19036_c0_g1_i1.p2  ORF type:complete len:203 (-),score=20.17 TRINITY_DN19036_c0_g1_i1:300-908(-)